MPTYDYACDACGHRFEEFQSFSADPLKWCPKCQTDKLRRLFGTGAAILFKGSGFYETDYRSESYKKAEKAESAPAKPAESTPSTGSPAPSTGSTPAKSDGPAK
ncbi:MAG TPA: zinc ribbon domain-containing protein [Gemmataceae bacterium]|nr:zinc ribbon domain-containing protein [Gemmataceae bacterium]